MRASLALTTVVVLLALGAPAASAKYGAGSEVEADAPLVLDGRVDALLPDGIASLVGEPATKPTLALRAREAHLLVREVSQACTRGPAGLPTGPCAGTQVHDDTVTLRDATVTLVKPIAAYKVLVTTDRQHADTPTFGASGRLVATVGVNTVFAATTDAFATSGFDEGWSSSGSKAVEEPVYGVDRLAARLDATGALVRATGGFEVFLQGVQVKVTGTDEDGEPATRTIDVPATRGGETVRYLVIEVADGDLTATTATGSFTAFAPSDERPVLDARQPVTLRAASGRVVKAGAGEQEYERDDVTLEAPVSLTLVRTVDGDPPRLGFTLSSDLRVATLAPPAPEDEPADAGELIAAGAAGAGGAGALLALAYFWPRLKYFLTAAFLPLYSRIERTSVLEHEKRDEIYELIRQTPGIHAHEIGERVQIGWGTTVYHLKLLESHSLVVSKKSGRYKRFFVNTGEYTKKKEVYGALRNETAKGVAQYIVDHPGTSQKDMCAALGIQPSLASWHVEKLEGVGLVKRVKDGRQVRYFAGPAWSDLNVQVDPAGGAHAPAET